MIRRFHILSAVFLAALFIPLAAQADDKPSGMSPAAYAELRTAIDVLKAHHINRNEVDWPALETQAFAQVSTAQTASDVYPAIQFLIAALREKHTFFMDPDEWRARATGKPSGNVQPPSSPLPQSESLGDVGHIVLPWHSGPPQGDEAYVATIYAALARFQAEGVCRYIIDLRGNSGGSWAPMIAGVTPLLGNGPFGYWIYGGGYETPWPDLAHPEGEGAPVYAPPPPAQPDAFVAVLVNRYTSSSGEFTAIAFEGRRNTRIFGELAMGDVTGNTAYALPDDAHIAVSMSRALDRNKRLYRTGVTPDEATPLGHATQNAAVNWLDRQSCAR
jgi:C-terminal processing protease CtpA/Prc